ncbi:MAG TPA: glycosyltransferase family protein [Rhodothermales bacterium]|nr:glycosyltransferase family protein [Rhodothermales bacterium]
MRVCTIEARMTSTRLPGKVMKPILGRPSLELMIERLRRAQRLDQIVVATTTNSTDDVIEDLAGKLDVGCFRGSEEDVLGRVLGAAKAYEADLIVETTGDCPLIDPFLVDQVVGTLEANDVDYCANCVVKTYPLGMAVQAFPTRVLEQVDRLTQDPADREHVSLYIYEHPERFRLLHVISGFGQEISQYRLTVDTPEDFEVVTRVFETLYPSRSDFGLADIVDYLHRHPDVAAINRHVAQKSAR